MAAVLDVLILVSLAVGAFLIKRAVGPALTKGAEDAVTEALKQRNWPAELARELEKERGTQRQELRFESYGKLWAKMRPLAVYSKEDVDRSSVLKLSDDLSTWYCSDAGGLMLTEHARDLYFAFQDLLRRIGALPDWEAARPDSRVRVENVFRTLAEQKELTGAVAMLDHVKATGADDRTATTLPISGWRDGLEQITAATWNALGPVDRFAVVQQASSVLRTGLTKDVQSRLR